MLPLRAAKPQLRRLLAVLAVVAAFAFQMRVGGLVVVDMGVGGGAMTGPPTTPPARHTSELVRPPVPDPHSHQRGRSTSGESGQTSHSHAAHCPFCVTGAFALEAGVLPLPTAPPRLAPQTLAVAPAHRPASPRHADARAPPVSL